MNINLKLPKNFAITTVNFLFNTYKIFCKTFYYQTFIIKFLQSFRKLPNFALNLPKIFSKIIIYLLKIYTQNFQVSSLIFLNLSLKLKKKNYFEILLKRKSDSFLKIVQSLRRILPYFINILPRIFQTLFRFSPNMTFLKILIN